MQANRDIQPYFEEPSDYLNRVLVVEDSTTERFRFAALLTNLGYEVFQAANGQEALEWIRQNKVAIILSDWSMPVMSGLELCRHVRKEGIGDPYFILVTGRDTMSDLVAGIESGADDFIAKPFNREELRVRLIAGQRIMRMRQSLESQNRQLQCYIEREEIAAKQTKSDLAMASDMLLDLLPENKKLCQSFSVAGVFQPATEIGGDFYNYFRLDDNHVGFYLLDVAGHGIPAALLSFSLARTISAVPKNESILFDKGEIRKPGAVVKLLNDHYLNQGSISQYFTMIYGVIEVSTGKGSLCQAGHPHPFIIRENGIAQEIGGGGFPVSILPGVDFEEIPFELAKGERLVIYSDGISECENEQGRQFGLDQFMQLMASQRTSALDQAVEETFEGVKNWLSREKPVDDMAFIVLERI